MTDDNDNLARAALGLPAPAPAPIVRPQQYWVGQPPTSDDFRSFIFDEFVDGRTKDGPWATMSPESFKAHGAGLGPGRGQRYRRQTDGRWLKVEG